MKALSLDTHKARVSAFKARKADLGLVGAIRSEGGAIDLASIMVGVIVIGIIGGVIAAAVFAVIPWSQDKAATQALDAVKTAESVTYAFGAESGTSSYLDYAGITTGDGTGAGSKPLLQKSDNIAIDVTTAADGSTPASYQAYSKSATGKIFELDSADPTKVTTVTGDITGNVFIAG